MEEKVDEPDSNLNSVNFEKSIEDIQKPNEKTTEDSRNEAVNFARDLTNRSSSVSNGEPIQQKQPSRSSAATATIKTTNTHKMYTLNDARKVDNNRPISEELTSQDKIPNYIFKMLMSVDYHVREFQLKNDSTKGNDEDSDKSEDEDDLGVNPMDAMLGILHRSDDTLRRYIVNKLSACQLSVPFLLPHPDAPSENVKILLSALESITKCWKDGTDTKLVFATEHPFPVVSFIRIGKPTMSKSSLINEIMSDGESTHNFFFNKKMNGGHVKRKVVDGLVEVSWFLPSGRETQILQNEICFANLRGDARYFKKQLDLLSAISSIIFILLPSEYGEKTGETIPIKFLEETIFSITNFNGKAILIFNEKIRQTNALEYFNDLKSRKTELSSITSAKKQNYHRFLLSIREKIQVNVNRKLKESSPLVKLASRKNHDLDETLAQAVSNLDQVRAKQDDTDPENTRGKDYISLDNTSGKDDTETKDTSGKDDIPVDDTNTKDTSGKDDIPVDDTDTKDTSGKDDTDTKDTSGKDDIPVDDTDTKDTSGKDDIPVDDTDTKDTSGKDDTDTKDTSGKDDADTKDTSGKDDADTKDTSGKDDTDTKDTSGKDDIPVDDTDTKDTSGKDDIPVDDTDTKDTSGKDDTDTKDTSGKDDADTKDTSGKDDADTKDTSGKDDIPVDDADTKDTSGKDDIPVDDTDTKDTSGKDDIPVNDADTKDTSGKDDIPVDDTDTKDTSGKDDTDTKDTSGKDDTDTKDTSEKNDADTKETSGKDDTDTKDTSGKDDIPVDDADTKDTSGKDDIPVDADTKDTSGKDDIPVDDTDTKDTSGRDDTDTKDTSEKNDIPVDDADTKDTSGKDDTDTKDTSGKDDIPVDDADTKDTSGKDDIPVDDTDTKDTSGKDDIPVDDTDTKDTSGKDDIPVDDTDTKDTSGKDDTDTKDTSGKDDIPVDDTDTKDTSGKDDTDTKDTSGKDDTDTKDTSEKNDADTKETSGKDDTDTKDTSGKDDIPVDDADTKDTSGKDDIPVDDTDTKDTSGKDDIPVDDADTKDTSGKDDIPVDDADTKDTSGKDDIPVDDTDTKDTSGRDDTDTKDTSEKNDIPVDDADTKDTSGKDDTDTKDTSGKDDIPVDDADTKDTSGKDDTDTKDTSGKDDIPVDDADTKDTSGKDDIPVDDTDTKDTSGKDDIPVDDADTKDTSGKDDTDTKDTSGKDDTDTKDTSGKDDIPIDDTDTKDTSGKDDTPIDDTDTKDTSGKDDTDTKDTSGKDDTDTKDTSGKDDIPVDDADTKDTNGKDDIPVDDADTKDTSGKDDTNTKDTSKKDDIPVDDTDTKDTCGKDYIRAGINAHQMSDDDSHELRLEFEMKFSSWLKLEIENIKDLLKLQKHIPVLAKLIRERYCPKFLSSKTEKSENVHENVDKIDKNIKSEKIAQKETLKNMDERILNSLNCIATMYEIERNYTVNSLKHCLDKMSLQIMTNLREDYEIAKKELRKKEETSPESDQQSPEEKHLKELDEAISKYSFGLEHIIRELAQLYEIGESKYDYAGAAADMLLSGQPLEILDGDSSYIPLRWFKAVYNKLDDKTNKAKTFVISTLGIQSSGKSTMLNTMFGLEFPVSAGRCTRGAFANLLPVSDSLKSNSGFDYVLIIDTEGLEGSADPEIRIHDNRMATFAIGVADVAIVNIMGESHHEIKGFLEIAVHAFLKMNLVEDRKRSCKIVHQNVEAANAENILSSKRSELKKDLDKMTELAATEENCGPKYKKIGDIISFDEHEDVFYIPGLLKGSRPMAPVNPDYGRAVQRVKETIINLMCSEKCLKISFSQFQDRVCKLWESMLRENFIFSFRNVIEVRAFTSLDRKYFNELVKLMVIKMGELQTEIEVALKRCSTQEELIEEWERKEIEIPEEADKLGNKMKEAMNEFFKTDQDKAILEQWRENIMNRITEQKEIQVRQVRRNCESTFNFLQNLQNVEKIKQTYEKEFLEKARNFITSTAAVIDDEKELNAKFEQEWEQWIAGVPKHKEKKNDVNNEMVNVLCNTNPALNAKMRKKLEKQNYNIVTINDSDASTGILESAWGYVLGKKKKPWHPEDRRIKYTAKSKAVKFAKKALRSGARCTRNNLTQMSHIVVTTIDEETKKSIFKSSKSQESLKCDILLHAFSASYEIFNEMEERFIQRRDIRAELERNLRPEFAKYFENACKETEKEKLAATSFVEALKTPFKLALNSTLGGAVASKMSDEITYKRKGQFHAKALIELGEGKKFESYKHYLADPVDFLSTRLKVLAEDYCLNDSKKMEDNSKPEERSVFKEKIREIESEVLQAISTANKETESENKKLTSWIQRFVDQCKTLVIKNETFALVEINDLEDIKVYKGDVINKVNDFVNTLINNGLNREDIKLLNPSPSDILINETIGCQCVCPFCGVLCDTDPKNHEGMEENNTHATRVHRPGGIRGYFYTSSRKLVTEICTTNVAGKGKFKNRDISEFIPFKDYQSVNDYYKSWAIEPNKLLEYEALKYFKWFMVHFSKELAEYYNAEEPDIPKKWKSVTFEDAKEELEQKYNL
ncbi:interferon-induced very large GTPase 1-like isoform X6 [Dendronephthya gigantea]|uniref:interferon-induced very large GTPase 1-like isoform X6 n=1 Tax=Dendronephthya gigantea TaxID=151771 RepID=UPI001069C200|nr:interferon-induced very large GTPase 1-like isoform X6 [Dendronephthya gigantea]